ncbi:hypothetical protein B296_00032606 [Ensete ventricosum]|uniref:Uncharacterized protein n=1 Tax=Ensete ventricosum TaxID=4639 RepID=A0A426YYC0_ENSVE|nr:hypothetical protein B296_00032606 [Ensete ventricosum]
MRNQGSPFRSVPPVRTGPTRYRYADRSLLGGTIEIRVSLRGNEATPCLPAVVERGDASSKRLWLDGFQKLSSILSAKELSDLQEVMRDKELNLRTDVYEILLQDEVPA